jgi:hypothetical protein
MKSQVAAFLGVVAVGVAMWLIPASVHIVEWSDSGPHRLALLASQTRLAVLIATTLAGGAALFFFGALRASLAWLCLLWLWALPFLPGIPDRFPLLLIFAGPLRWLVAAVGIVGTLRGLRRQPTGSAEPIRHDKPFNVRTARIAVFVGSLALYLTLGALHARAIGPGGDEPHYLIIAHSLLKDGDLQINNNHVNGDYRAFWAGPPLRPDFMRRGLDGEIYSIHAPGLAVLILPFYAIAGYGGVVAFLCLIAALTALAIFDLAFDIAGARAAIITFAAVTLTVPFLPHGWLIFPETPAALIVAWAARWLWRGSDRIGIGSLIACGALLGVLPWLHTKFVIFLALFGAALLWQLRRRPLAAVALAAPMAVSVGSWLAFFYSIYGTFNPEAPYGDYPRLYVLTRNIPRGLLGLLFDQKFGLLPYAPVYLFAAVGTWLMLRQREWRWFGAVLLTVTAFHVGSTTRLYMWWGGNSAPARFLVPILPCLAPSIAVAAAQWRSPAARALLWTTLAASVVMAIGGLADPQRLLLFSDPRGKGRIVELMQGPAPLTSILPTFAQQEWRTPLWMLLPWLAAAAIAFGAVWAIRRRGHAPLTLATCGGLVFIIAASLMAVRISADERLEAARRGAAEVLWEYDATRMHALDYGRLARVDQNAVLGLSRIAVDRGSGAADSTQRMMVGPVSLPAGSYQARIWFSDGVTQDGDIIVSSSDRAVYARVSSSVQSPVSVPFQLPFAVRRLTVMATGSAAQLAVKAEIDPLSVVPPRERESALLRSIEAIPARPGAYIGYVNEHAYPENGVFWSRGTGQAEVLVAPAGARRLSVTLFSGPSGADCTVILFGDPQTVKTSPGQTSSVSFAVPSGRRFVPLAVRASAFFRPSDADPASTDGRGLGCQVRIGLE